jgi:hypothetical protein
VVGLFDKNMGGVLQLGWGGGGGGGGGRWILPTNLLVDLVLGESMPHGCSILVVKIRISISSFIST